MYATSRKVVLNGKYEDQVCRKQSFAAACFHGTMLFPVYHCFRSGYPGVIMVSRSWDGELIDRCLRRWGYVTVRGSSSRRGKEALSEMIDLVDREGFNAGLAVDAPRGPARKVKMGIVLLARDTGRPIVPIVSWATRKIQFRSWDEMIVPLPFGTIVCAFGKPIEVPKGLTEDAYERIRQEIETEMHGISEQAEAHVEALMSAGRALSPRNA
jgi:lysophospholipid acyltransferase (LPLAT)-like uncharacterized protein